jgi:hypothetical protein
MQPVPGDPPAMRAAAAQLRYRAAEFARLAATVDAQAAAMGFAGPAADRWRVAVGTEGGRLRAAAARLEDSADTLLRAAAEVEIEQRLHAQSGEVGSWLL